MVSHPTPTPPARVRAPPTKMFFYFNLGPDYAENSRLILHHYLLSSYIHIKVIFLYFYVPCISNQINCSVQARLYRPPYTLRRIRVLKEATVIVRRTKSAD